MSEAWTRVLERLGQQVARAEAAEAEVERLTQWMADRDRRLEKMLREIRAVLDLHWPQHDAFDDRVIVGCGHCSCPWPCPTVAALNGGSSEVAAILHRDGA